jgi:hypothetical protein
MYPANKIEILSSFLFLSVFICVHPCFRFFVPVSLMAHKQHGFCSVVVQAQLHCAMLTYWKASMELRQPQTDGPKGKPGG